MIENAVSLRPATEEDLAKVLEIENAIYPLPWTKDQFLEELKKPFSRFLVLTDDETDSVVMAYAVYWLMFDECHLLNIAVHLEWRGLGFAKKIMGQLIKESLQKGAKKIILEVRISNKPAIEFYQSLGFFIDHTKKDFYSDGESAYFMTLYLDKKNTF